MRGAGLVALMLGALVQPAQSPAEAQGEPPEAAVAPPSPDPSFAATISAVADTSSQLAALERARRVADFDLVWGLE